MATQSSRGPQVKLRVDLKVCSKCAEAKPVGYFSKNKAKSDGYSHYCKLCAKNAMQRWRQENPGVANEATRRWRAEHPDQARASAKKSDAKRAGRPDRKKQTAEAIAEWRKINTGRVNGYTASRRAQQARATVKWANSERITEFYSLAAAWNSIWPEDTVHIDHIVPLNGKTVSGLHTEHNMQIIRSITNSEKGNRWWPGMP